MFRGERYSIFLTCYWSEKYKQKWRKHMEQQAFDYARVNIDNYDLPRFLFGHLEACYKYAFECGRKFKDKQG